MSKVLFDARTAPLRNYIPRPDLGNATGNVSAGSQIPVSTSYSINSRGKGARRLIVSGAATSANWAMALYVGRGVTRAGVANEQLLIGIRLRASKPMTATLALGYGNATAILSGGPTIAVTTTEQTFWHTATVIGAAIGESFNIRVGLAGAANGGLTGMNIDDWIEASEPIITEARAPQVYMDGDTPNWHWLGTPGQSESVGYPYTLESIAGAPMADLAGDGVQGAISGSALSGFTVYTVYDVSAVNVNYHSIFALSQNPLGQAPDWNNGALSYARRGGGDGTTGHIRVGTSAGNNQLGISSLPGGSTIATDTFTIGRHIGVVTAPDGLASVTFMSDTSVPVTRSINAGTGIVRGYLWAKGSINDLGSPSSIQKAVRTLYYPVNHDTKTRGKIVAWLSWAYGTSPLESIAGAPVAFIEGNNQSSTAPVTIDGLQGRTLYSVFDIVNQDAPNQSIIRSGAATAANGAMQLMHGTAGTDQFRIGAATLNGSDFSQSSTVSGRTIGRHIGSVAMATGAATVTGWFDTQPVISVGRTPGGGMPEATLRRSVNASHAYVYDVLFDDAHSDRTRQRITDWLRTRYATAPTISTLIGGLTNLDTVLNVSYTQTGSRPITAVIETLPLNASSGTWTAQTTTTQYVSETGMVASWTFNSSLNQQIGDTLRVRVTLTNGAGNVTSQELVMTVEDGS